MTDEQIVQYIAMGIPCLVFVVGCGMLFRSSIRFLDSAKKRADKEATVADLASIKLESDLFALDMKTAREVAYDAAGFVTEQEGKARKSGNPMDWETKRREAVKYMQRHIGISEQDAIDALESTLGKVPGCGASGREKV